MPTDLFEEILGGCCCNVESCCDDCSCQVYGNPYTDSGILVDSALEAGSTAVVQECNSLCKCSDQCRNRVTQKGIIVRLEVFKHDEKGLGLRTLDFVRRGQFICEYAGEVIPELEAQNRLDALTKDDMNYLFILREHFKSSIFCTYIDPRYKGNIGRFINHSCNPNLCVVPVRVNNMIPRVCLFASRDILAGEEVTYDYGQNNCDKVKASIILCKCESENCRGYLPFDTT